MPSDRERLQSFLHEVHTLLKDVVLTRDSYFREPMRPLFRAAWAEVEPVFNTLDFELRHESPDAQIEGKLEAAGLTGAQLDLKLAGFERALENWRTNGHTPALLGKVLNWINTLLKSLISVLPGGEALKEFKESIENELAE